jgi:DNA-binding transcriptional LysR family regulator
VTGPQATTSFRLAYVPGVTPGKWARTWHERLPDVPLDLISASAVEAAEALRSDGADAALVRLPIDRTGMSAIPLYTETTVVVVPKDHEVTAVDEVSLADLADYIVLHPLDDSLDWPSPPGLPALERPATTADAIELVAAGVGLLVVPQSLARLYHRKDLTYRPMPEAPQSQIALSWPEAQTTELMEEFIGIVRGRTVNSSRGRAPAPTAEQAKPKRSDSGDARKKPATRKSGSGGSQNAKQGKPRRRS